MINFTLKTHGTKQVAAELRKLARTYPEALRKAMLEEGYALEAESVPLVPVEHGILKNSHYVKEINLLGTDTVHVGYSAEYAVYVHERTELHHDHGQAKFLEEPFLRRMTGYFDRLAARIRGYIGGG